MIVLCKCSVCCRASLTSRSLAADLKSLSVTYPWLHTLANAELNHSRACESSCFASSLSRCLLNSSSSLKAGVVEALSRRSGARSPLTGD